VIYSCPIRLRHKNQRRATLANAKLGKMYRNSLDYTPPPDLAKEGEFQELENTFLKFAE